MTVLYEESIHLPRARAVSTSLLAKRLLEHHLNAGTPTTFTKSLVRGHWPRDIIYEDCAPNAESGGGGRGG